jgi:non-ribosomal peptide synthetase component F
VVTLDCRAAQFSEDESTSQLRMICQSWKVMFQAEYSSGQPMRMLAELRGVVDAAVAQTFELPMAEPQQLENHREENPAADDLADTQSQDSHEPALLAHAAAAGADGDSVSVPDADIAEFEVSTDPLPDTSEES